MSAPYIDPMVKKYFETFEAGTQQVKAYFYGEPYQVPASQMPAIFMSKVTTEVSPLNNASDEHQIEFQLTLVTDIRQTLDDEKKVVAGISQLYEIIEGRDATTYALKDESLLQILRTNIHIDTAQNLRTDLGSTTRVDYGDNVRNRTKQWFIEAHIRFVAHYSQTR